MSSLQSRILIGLVGFPSVIYVILNHIVVFNIIVVFCFALAFREFIMIVSNFNNRTYWLFFGTIYIFGSMISLIYLRSIDSLLSCLLYTSPSPRDRTRYRMPSSA